MIPVIGMIKHVDFLPKFLTWVIILETNSIILKILEWYPIAIYENVDPIPPPAL